MDDIDFFGSKYFKEGFKHCFVIERQSGFWMCHDPSRRDLFTTILPAPGEADVIQNFILQNPDCTVLRCIVRPTAKNNFPAINIMSCVSVVQYMLGILCPLAMTPYRLYCKLKTGKFSHMETEELWVGEKLQEERRKLQHNYQGKKHQGCARKPMFSKDKQTSKNKRHKQYS